jgi:hypothetical protein
MRARPHDAALTVDEFISSRSGYVYATWTRSIVPSNGNGARS